MSTGLVKNNEDDTSVSPRTDDAAEDEPNELNKSYEPKLSECGICVPFPQEKLEAMKKEVMSSLPAGVRVSTNDILTANLWKMLASLKVLFFIQIDFSLSSPTKNITQRLLKR